MCDLYFDLNLIRYVLIIFAYFIAYELFLHTSIYHIDIFGLINV